ncbi:transposase family protein [Burkholderia ubonensis]|uniref:transposase family protein n=1 Tax=Burkholderia ubonensis TaxID=101571 RepID=UPI0009B3F18D
MSVTLDDYERAIFVRVRANARLVCPQGDRRCPRYDIRPRRWRHLDTCDYRAIIEADVPRIECSEHDRLTVQVT